MFQNEVKLNFVEASDLIAYPVIVTPEKARYYLEECNYPYNRPIMRRQVDILKTAVEKGQFNQGTSVHFGVVDSREYLLDGQHRLTAILETGVSQQMTIVYQTVDSFDDLPYIYARFDRHAKRSAADTYHAFNLGEKTGLSRKQIAKADGAVRLIMSSFHPNSKKGLYYSDFEIMPEIDRYKDYIKIYHELISGCMTKLRDAMLRRSTMAIALVTLDEASNYMTSDRICAFWQRVADGNGLEKNDPRFRLRDKLLTTRISGGANPGVTEQVSLIDACRMTTVAWNAYAEGKTLSRFVLPKEALPIKFTSYAISPKQGT